MPRKAKTKAEPKAAKPSSAAIGGQQSGECMKKLIIAAAVAAVCASAHTPAVDLFAGIAGIADKASELAKMPKSEAIGIAETYAHAQSSEDGNDDAEISPNGQSEQEQNADAKPAGSNSESADARIFSLEIREESIESDDLPRARKDSDAEENDGEGTDYQDAKCPDEDVYGDCEDGFGDQNVPLQSGGEISERSDVPLLPEDKRKSQTAKGNGWAPKSVIAAPSYDLPTLPDAEVLPIARGHLNRIITPFEKPEAKTSADVSIEIRGSVAYITADTPQPFTVYFTETGNEDTALTVHFMAVSGMPSPIDLRTKMPSKARNAIDAEGFADKLAASMAAAAAGKTPYGFERTDEFEKAPCHYPAVSVSGSFAYFESSDYAISVHEARMTEKSAVHLDDAACDPRAAAIGFYPLHDLRNIGDTTFIIAARKKEDIQ